MIDLDPVIPPQRNDQDAPTLGVEEEFLVVDPATGAPLPAAAAVVGAAGQMGVELHYELTTAQVEVNTPVCHDMREVGAQLRAARAVAAAAALQNGGQLLPVGVPLTGPLRQQVTDADRYRRMVEEFGLLAVEHGVCGCHVHVGVPDRETAVQVGNHLRPWLPVLLALSANSPIYDGVDTGYASWRSVLCARWPCWGAPPYFRSLDEYAATTAMLIDSGVALDAGMIYWDVRPSWHLPTVEVRVSDVPATVDGTVLLAVLVRGLVTTAVRAVRAGVPAPLVGAEALRAAYWRAARDGVTGSALDVVSGRLVPATEMLNQLLRHVRPVLADTGELRATRTLLTRVLRNGNGAVLQRAAFGVRGSLLDVVSTLARHALQDRAPDTAA
ncbi:carboxylate-amine ligase [Actinophytocola xanthii]|uniref:Putative glutamate--cysteine ligase 2 n=1 Tax=Actinophytocola xanthii TaxID=1912961 RepID=A0A1Q8CWL1_9PSEU|nr:glutamate--cysteine ligase [Actinophytocola xanthii]OLF18740.1 carboxylate--amine ligase [Actinophytocola xanthii]